MHQEYIDIFRKIFLYVKVVHIYKEEIKEIQISNEIEEYFGKKYCRIYVKINLKEDSYKHYEIQTKIATEFYNCGEKEYFSFYLGSTEYYKDDNEEQLHNRGEEVHYYYIYNLLYLYLKEDNIPIKLSWFKNEWHLKIEREKSHREFEEKWNKINAVTNGLTPKVGQLVAVCNYQTLRLGVVTKIILPSRRQTFNLELSEVKKELDAGKVKIRHVSQRDIHAIVQPELLERRYSKSDLIDLIEKEEPFKGLIWRRPQELWKQ